MKNDINDAILGYIIGLGFAVENRTITQEQADTYMIWLFIIRDNPNINGKYMSMQEARTIYYMYESIAWTRYMNGLSLDTQDMHDMQAIFNGIDN